MNRVERTNEGTSVRSLNHHCKLPSKNAYAACNQREKGKEEADREGEGHC